MNRQARISLRSRLAGFTLLELLIALVLTGLISVLAYSGLKLGLDSWSRVIDRDDKKSEILLTQQFLRRLLSSANPDLVEDIDQRASYQAFWGLENEILFLSPLPLYDQETSPLWIYLAVKEDEQEGPALRMETIPYDNEALVNWDELLSSFRGGDSLNSFILSSGTIDQIEFRYLELSDHQEPEWQDEWRDQGTKPLAINVRFLNRDSDTDVWPELTITAREKSYEILSPW